ncbi:MAG: L-2-amino-thiazoline-4-carboxylic acid hydrolase [Candidatus Kapabacteria bacterium]|nr:L-2-amino-thiazoline-4-carboxylic acid hydrolase [Candidatus Kapabacteria bacterium]
MAIEIPIEKKFKILCGIARAQHFAWREACRQLVPELDTTEIVNKMWEVSARDTANAYLKMLDKDKSLPMQIAESVVKSSITMGEDAKLIKGDGVDEYFVRHDGCPWFDWHKNLGLLAEDRPGCDNWYFKTVEFMNEKLATNVRIETTNSLPDGDDCCLRRIWIEQ